jgi:hypothetical protein
MHTHTHTHTHRHTKHTNTCISNCCLQEDFGKTSAAVTNVLGFLGWGGGSKKEEEQKLAR